MKKKTVKSGTAPPLPAAVGTPLSPPHKPPAGHGGGSDRESLALLVLLTVFVLLSALWALAIPIPADRADATVWDGYNPDEQFHMRYIAYLGTHFRLPVPWIGTEANGSGLYTAIHPPLYYALGAIVYLMAAPLLGYAKVLLLLRFVGCLIGAGVVYVTYQTARRLFPHDISLLSAGFVAGVPMFVSLSGAVTNEVFATLAASLALLTMVNGLADGFNLRRAVLLSVFVTAGLATKVSDIALFPPAILALLLAPRVKRADPSGESRSRLTNILILLSVPAVGIGWWFLRNQIIYGDPLQARQHYAYWISTDQHPWQTIMTRRQFFWNASIFGWESFWGTFDAFTRPLPAYGYYAILFLQVPAAAGILIFVWRAGLKDVVVRHTTLVLTLFAALIDIIFFMVNWRIFSPQGRYLFALMTPFGIAGAVGWTAIWQPRLRFIPVIVALAVLLALNLYALILMPLRPIGH